MRRIAIITAAWAVVGCLSGLAWGQGAAQSQPTTGAASLAVLLEKGIYTEETVGDLDAAIKLYQQIVNDAKANRQYAAQAQYRLAMCYLKKGENAQAIKSLKELTTSFPDQAEFVAKAQEQIAKAKGGMSDVEIAKIVGEAVTDISTMPDGDPRIAGLLQSLRELNELVVVTDLTKYFDSEKNTVRRAAVYVLWKGGFSDVSSAVPGLVKLCSHQEDLTRGMAAIALGGLKARSAFDAIADMTANDKSPFARRSAAYALGLLGDSRAKPVLEKAIKDSDALVRNNAEAALTMLAKTSATGSAAQPAPRVVKTTPAAFDNNVDPLLDKITVTFGRPMTDKSWSWTGGGSTYPDTPGPPSYDAARTTCSMPVKLDPGKAYWVGVNSPSHQNFKSADGARAKRYVIFFATKSADGNPTPLPQELVKQAMQVNTGLAGLLTAQLEDNMFLDLDTGKTMAAISEEWPDAYDVAWDNDMGGVIMIKPKSPKVRIMSLPEAKDIDESTIRKILEPDMRKLLSMSQERGMPAPRGRFVIVMTDEGKIALVQILNFSRKQAQLCWIVGSPEELAKQVQATNSAAHGNVASPRNVVEEFLTAVKAGDTAKALTFTSPASAVGHQLSDFAKITDLANAVIAGHYADANKALVITSDLADDRGRKGPMLVYLLKQRDLWVISDIDLESPDGAKKKLDSLLTGENGLAAPRAISDTFVIALAASDADSALKLASKEFKDRKKQELPQLAKGMDLTSARPISMALYANSARIVYWPTTVKATAARFYLCLTLTQAGTGPGSWFVSDADFVEKQTIAEGFMSAPGSQPSAGEKEILKAKLVNWVEKFFSENYRDITARKTLEWGQPETTPAGNLSIRYKYLATIWNKDQVVIDQRFTFTPEGKYVSAETIEKGPASQPGTQPGPAEKKAAEDLTTEGWQLWKDRKLPEAEAKFKAALAKDPANANAWNGLGWAQLNQGKPANAKEAFTKAVELEPKSAASLNGLGWIAKGEGKTDAAIEFWNKAVAAAPTATAALSGLASTYAELGLFDKAIEAYKAWLKLEPGSAEAKAGLKKAQEAAEAVKAAVPAAQEWLKLVDAGKYGDAWDAAAPYLQKAVSKEQLVGPLQANRSPLGKVLGRKVMSAVLTTSLPGAPDGQYVVIQFETTFENKRQAVETVTPMKDQDGKWLVSGYFIK